MSEASADENLHSVAEEPDEFSKHEAVTKVGKDTATCKKPIKEVSEKPPKRKITHDVLEEQYKALLLKQSNLKLNKKKLELEIALLEQKYANIKETETCGNLMTTINLSPKWLADLSSCTFTYLTIVAELMMMFKIFHIRGFYFSVFNSVF